MDRPLPASRRDAGRGEDTIDARLGDAGGENGHLGSHERAVLPRWPISLVL